ncbi:hypothetical protein HK405_001388, partial [Cladochytrium tenue]
RSSTERHSRRSAAAGVAAASPPPAEDQAAKARIAEERGCLAASAASRSRRAGRDQGTIPVPRSPFYSPSVSPNSNATVCFDRFSSPFRYSSQADGQPYSPSFATLAPPAVHRFSQSGASAAFSDVTAASSGSSVASSGLGAFAHFADSSSRDSVTKPRLSVSSAVPSPPSQRKVDASALKGSARPAPRPRARSSPAAPGIGDNGTSSNRKACVESSTAPSCPSSAFAETLQDTHPTQMPPKDSLATLPSGVPAMPSLPRRRTRFSSLDRPAAHKVTFADSTPGHKPQLLRESSADADVPSSESPTSTLQRRCAQSRKHSVHDVPADDLPEPLLRTENAPSGSRLAAFDVLALIGRGALASVHLVRERRDSSDGAVAHANNADTRRVVRSSGGGSEGSDQLFALKA